MPEMAKRYETLDSMPSRPTQSRGDSLGILVFSLVCLNLVAVGWMGFLMQKMWDRMQDQQVAIQKLQNRPVVDENVLGRELQPHGLGTLFALESFLVNIPSDQGPKFLQTQMELELSEPALEDEITRKKAAIRDSIIVMLSSRPYKELRDAVGMKKLRTDLLRVINNLLATGKVREIYFTQFHFN